MFGIMRRIPVEITLELTPKHHETTTSASQTNTNQLNYSLELGNFLFYFPMFLIFNLVSTQESLELRLGKTMHDQETSNFNSEISWRRKILILETKK